MQLSSASQSLANWGGGGGVVGRLHGFGFKGLGFEKRLVLLRRVCEGERAYE